MAIYLLIRFTFGLGLLVSSMANPAKIQAFFAISLIPLSLDKWDPSLALIILFGIVPNIILNLWRGFEKPPAYVDRFSLPTKQWQDVDIKFILCAVAFGIAWGVSGICPGPAVLRAVAQPVWGALWFAGFWVSGAI